jgi:hypothetical protein
MYKRKGLFFQFLIVTCHTLNSSLAKSDEILLEIAGSARDFVQIDRISPEKCRFWEKLPELRA